MYWLALYRGRGRFFSDTLVRLVTRSDYSHCEILRADAEPQVGETHLCGSSSARDGGVRVKDITFDAGKWEFQPIPWAPENAWDAITENAGRRYDYRGLLLTQFFHFRLHSRTRWFCSEICAHALGLSRPHAYAPGDLDRLVRDITRISESHAEAKTPGPMA